MEKGCNMKKIYVAFLFVLSVSVAHAVNRDFFNEPIFDPETEMPIIQDANYYDSIIKNRFLWQLSFDEWFNGPHFLAGAGGARRILEENGVVPVITYIGNFAANPVGGRARGSAFSSSVNLGLGIDLEKVTGIKELSGWSLNNTWVWRFGESITNDYIGNEFNVQQNYGNQTIRMQSLFANYTKDIDDWTFTFRFGRFAAGDTFLTKPIYWLYQNNAMDGNPVGIFKQMKWSAYPAGTWAAYTKISYRDGQYFKAGVYQINNDRQDSQYMHGLDWSFNGLGVNTNFELGWDINHDNSGKSPASVSAGIAIDWYNAPHFSNPMVCSTCTYTVYLQADYMLWNMGYVKTNEARYITRDDSAYRDLRGIVLWGVVQYNPNQDTALMPVFVNGGLLFNAPFKSRADDVLCFGVAYGKYSTKLTDEQKRGSYEAVLELNYKFQINRFLFVQPNVQYIINTAGGTYPDSFVLGMQFGANF